VPSGIPQSLKVKMLWGLEFRILGARDRRERRACCSATRRPIDARISASGDEMDVGSRPSWRNFRFRPAKFSGAKKWKKVEISNFRRKRAAKFPGSRASCGKVVGLVELKRTQKTAPKNSEGRRRYDDFSKFSGRRNRRLAHARAEQWANVRSSVGRAYGDCRANAETAERSTAQEREECATPTFRTRPFSAEHCRMRRRIDFGDS
jgi:hypothetical protein